MENILGKDSRRFLMGLAIIFIIVYHIFFFGMRHVENAGFGLKTLEHFTANGYLGVDIFLFLSAYGLCFSYKSNSLGSYYGKRLLRILPTYVIFVLIYSFIYPRVDTIVDNPAIWLRQITGVNAFRDYCFNDIEWFTPALMLVYLLFPMLYFLMGKSIRYRWSIVMLILLLIVFRDHLCLFMAANLVGRLSIVLIGIFTYFMLHSEKDEKALMTYFLIFALLGFLSSNLMVHFSLLIPLLVYVLSKVRIPDNVFVKTVSWLGGLTFEIYLAQVISLQYFFQHTTKEYNLLVLTVISILSTAVLTAILYFGRKAIMCLIRRFRPGL